MPLGPLREAVEALARRLRLLPAAEAATLRAAVREAAGGYGAIVLQRLTPAIAGLFDRSLQELRPLAYSGD